MIRSLFVFLALLTCSLPATAAPYERTAGLAAFPLESASTTDALLAPRLLLWPQLQRDGDVLRLVAPGEKTRQLHIPEPEYTIGTIFGVAEGEWAVFTEIPKRGATAHFPERLMAIFLPRGNVTKWDLPGPLERRYAYAPRLFGFPNREGNGFHWLALPTSGNPAFGTITLQRNLVLLTIDGPRLVAKTVDPKSFQGTSSFHYVFYGLGKDANDNPTLSTLDTRTFPQSEDGRFDAFETFWHETHTVLARESGETGAPAITVVMADGGGGTALTARFLGYSDSRMAFQRDNNVEVAGIVVTNEITLKSLWSHPLATTSTLGEVVWITGVRMAGPMAVLELQVQLPGKDYPVEKLGTPVLAVWDTVSNTLVYELAGVKPEK